MVKLAVVQKCNVNIKARKGLVCVFAGGTSGIGEASLKALAGHATEPTVYIVGRNETRASRITAECQKLCAGGTFVFLQTDLTLLKNVDKVCSDILEREGRLDLLFMSQGDLTLQGRSDTTEGIDGLMCLRYYSRMRMLHNLLPSLLKAEHARVISIFSPGSEGRLHPDDLSLRSPSHYGVSTGISHVSFMTTFFFEEVVAQNPTLSCLHVFPGLVKTAEFENGLFPGWLKWFFKWIMLPLIIPFTVSIDECGERNLFHSISEMYPARAVGDDAGTANVLGEQGLKVATGTDGKVGSGVYAVNWNSEIIRKFTAIYEPWRKKDMGQAVWEHTLAAFKAVEEGRVFER